MTAKQNTGLFSPDGAQYVVLTDGAGTLSPASGGGGGGGLVTIGDGTTSPVVVTPASTAPAATDKALVVAISPNSVNANGQTTMAASAPVVLAIDQSQIPVSITGTAAISAASLPLPTGASTAANQILVHTPITPAAATATKGTLIGGQYNSTNAAFTNGQQGAVAIDQRGGLAIQDGQAIASVSVTSATTLFTVADTSGYGSVSLQVTSAGTTCTITYEASEDGTTWVSTAGYTAANTGNSIPVAITTTATQLVFPLHGKQFRARVSTYGSGTVTVQGTLRKDPIGLLGLYTTANGSIGDTINVGLNGIPSVFEGRTTNKTAVTTGQYVRPIATSVGATITKPFQVPELDWSFAAASGGITNTTTAVTLVAAAGAGIRNYVTGMQISSSTMGAATEIAIRDGASGTVIWRGFANTTASNPTAITFPSPLRSTANTLLEFVTLTASISGAIYVNAQGYQAP